MNAAAPGRETTARRLSGGRPAADPEPGPGGSPGGEAQDRRAYGSGPATGPVGSPGRGPGALTRLRDRDRARDQGQAAIEFAGVIALLLFVALAAIQVGIVAYTAQQAGTAARAAARTESAEDGSGRGAAAGRAAISGWLADGADFDSGRCADEDDEISVTAVVDVPSLLPGFDLDPAVRTVTMPCD
ncbi:TadE/TadG family type IV pilus assembly protein [Streptomyces sp. NPDC020875]|uniref:TadE/TadG family type IV pilus assembly protein n=1 Tax=Streptomyces sp. NPDC020875 TaxID=3154898 RepID=UPI0033D2A40E